MSVWAGTRRGTVVAVLGCVFLTSLGHGAERCDQWAARLESAQGSVQVQFAGETQWTGANHGDVFCEGDTVTLGEASRAALRLPNETVLRLDELSSLRLTAVKRDDESLLDMLKGAVHFLSRVPRSLKVQTPFVNAAIEGTEFVMRVDVAMAQITVFEGVVAASNDLGSVRAAAGEAVQAPKGEAPRQVAVISPVHAVQWALYYPPVFDMAELQRRTAGQPDEALQRQVNDYLYDAARDLYVGRVAQAEAALAQVIQLAPDNADALALRAVASVARNENAQALSLAQRAAEQAPDSAAARIALSYARQARFDLPAATDAARKATELEPDNALAHARLAELLLSQSELNAALAAAQKAVALDPDLGRTQTILGYAYLTRINTRDAQTTFERAAKLDPADPLPRLGLGLTRIRRGALEEGRQHIEVAASLDPNNALVRSYLGKAYYEEKRNPLAAVQYDLAKGLDPNDPTPWFYDAIRNQTENRPVEALEDINKSIELNDNRAVYRSRLQLDQDEAARSASLARVYRDLGFEQLAITSGTSATTRSPGDFSGHRFLSEAYSVLPRHEIAQASELLQSQMLQPVNRSPVRAQASNVTPASLEGLGPARPSLNDFNSLFSRNGANLLADVSLGSNGTAADEVVFTGLLGKASLNLAQFHYETDGYRPNDDYDQDLVTAFAQFDVTPALSFQVGWQDEALEAGDTTSRFDPDNYLPDLRQTQTQESARVGLRYSPASRHNILASHVRADSSDELTDLFITPDDPIIERDVFTNTGESRQIEVQYQYSGTGFRAIAGVGDVSADLTESYEIEVLLDSEVIDAIPVFDDKYELEHKNAYIYAPIDLSRTMTLVFGASYDSYERASDEKEQLNPKFGLVWNPSDRATVRLAAFRTLKRPIVANQTLEPTNVAGFNQFYDDTDRTDAKRYGAGFDYHFNGAVQAGLELSMRDLMVDVDRAGVVSEEERSEELHRAYLYWALSRQMVATAEFIYEDFDRETDPSRENLTNPAGMSTKYLPLSLSYFASSGLFLRLRPMLVWQEVGFQTTDGFSQDSENFLTTDLAVGVRLPKRRGIISASVSNLFDQDFRYQQPGSVSTSRPAPATLVPERTVLLNARLWF